MSSQIQRLEAENNRLKWTLEIENILFNIQIGAQNEYETMNTKHIDKNSFKHAGINFLLAAAGGIEYGGIQAATAASITKEWFDKQSYGHWCWWDLFFDIVGMVAGEAVHFLVFKHV